MEGRRSAGDAAEGRQYCSGLDGCGHESEGSTVELSLRLTTGSPAAEGERKSMTMFYKGQVCVVDVTELQARTIISMANRQLAQCDHQYHQTQEAAAAEAEAEAPPQPALLGTGLSMKRSLQRFLQKRKARAAAVAAPPYAGRPDHGSLKSSPTS